jgi:excisionase family DNA binding protein
MPSTIPVHLSPDDVRRRLGLSLDTVYRAITDRDPRKRLPAVKVRGQWRISESDLAAWLAQQPSNTPAAAPSAPQPVARRTRRPASRQGSARGTTGGAR